MEQAAIKWVERRWRTAGGGNQRRTGKTEKRGAGSSLRRQCGVHEITLMQSISF